MEHRNFEESGQNVLDSKCKNILHGEEKSTSLSPGFVQKEGIVGNQKSEMKIATQTPEKTNEPFRTKLKEKGVKYPEKYNIMMELFDSMTCSTRLLSLCKKSPTFENISTQVEVLTKRKLSLKNLAQIKYILPEAIQIEYILVHDKKTLCMEPDLKIALLFDVIEGHCQHSDFIALRQAFASRLINYLTTHPEACDIPEATLPEPFSHRHRALLENKGAEVPEELGSICGESQTISPDQFLVDSLESMPISIETDVPSTSPLLHPAFHRHFSRRSVAAETDKANLSTFSTSLSSAMSDDLNNQVVGTWNSRESPCDHQNNEDQQIKMPDTCSKPTIVNSPSRLISPQCVDTTHTFESPTQKLALPADSFMIETPLLVTPKRSMPSCDNKLKAMTIQDCTSCYKPAKRSLDFSHLEGERSALASVGMATDNYNVLRDIPQALEVETKEFIVEGNVIGSHMLLGEVEGSLGNLTGHCKTSQSSLAKDQRISVCLADLVALIHHIFQSVSRSSITKQELVHKIIMNNFDIIERREVEEQIEQLEKLVPDWICRKLAPGGDIIYNIKKVSDLASIQARLCT